MKTSIGAAAGQIRPIYGGNLELALVGGGERRKAVPQQHNVSSSHGRMMADNSISARPLKWLRVEATEMA